MIGGRIVLFLFIRNSKTGSMNASEIYMLCHKFMIPAIITVSIHPISQFDLIFKN